jgi:membrane peptidoglycan carboxypeptidase
VSGSSPSGGKRRNAPSGSTAPRRSGGGGKTGARPKKPLTGKQKLRRALKWCLLVALAGVVVIAGFAVVVYNTTSIPDPNAEFKTQTSYIYYADGKSKVGQFAMQNRDSISYDEMPQTLKDAVVAAEDRTFWTNHGIDPKGILRAAFSNAKGNSTQGASTITQQYVKVLYLNQERTYKRKIKEAVLSLKIQRQMSKQQILEGYLNTIYFGRGAYGVQAASEAYFGIPASKLNLRQSAVLASVLNNPSQFDPANGPTHKDALQHRYAYVLSGMAQAGNVTAEQATKAAAKLPAFPKQHASNTYGGQRGHALTLVKNELLRLGFTEEQIQGGGLRVTTTLTKKAMDAAANGVAEAKPEGFGDKELHIGVATVQPGTGALLGFYGGQDYLQSQINWAASGGMAGSTMKPITLTTALEAGFSLKSSFDGNSPYTFPGGLQVHNEGEQAGEADGHSYGSHVNAVYAMQQSINTAFVDMSNAIPSGPKKIYQNALKMGLTPEKSNPDYPGIPSTTVDLQPDDSLITLGKAAVSPINMANTYATIAAGGKRADVHVVDKVVDQNGTVLYKYKKHTDQAVPEDVSADVSYALQQTVQGGTGRAALALGRPAAGKTGTATNGDGDVSSAWFVGYTPQAATAVMYIRGKGREALDGWLPSYFGADYPARTWTDVMQGVMEGLPVESFPPPANVTGTPPDTEHAPMPSNPPKPKQSKAPKPPKSSKHDNKHDKHDKPSKSPAQQTPPSPPSKSPTGGTGSGSGNGSGSGSGTGTGGGTDPGAGTGGGTDPSSGSGGGTDPGTGGGTTGDPVGAGAP